MTTSSTNGHLSAEDDREIHRRVREVLNAIAEIPNRDEAQSSLFAPDTGPPPHDIDRHPEDPHGALHRSAEMVTDPELIRRYMVDLGITTHAIGDVQFDKLLRRILHGITGTRAGAITAPAQIAAGAQEKISASTTSAVQKILADRRADGMKADRLEEEKRPRLLQRVEENKSAVGVRELALEREEVAVADARRKEAEKKKAQESLKPNPIRAPHVIGGLMQWVRLPLWMAILSLAIDILLGALMLQGPISDLINTTEIGSYAIAIGISTTLGLASAAAGFALAAIRLPGKVIGAFFVTVFALLVVKLIGSLDALRLDHQSGIETLTVATLASCYVAALTGYAIAAWEDFAQQRKAIIPILDAQAQLIVDAGSDLGDAVKRRDDAGVQLAEAKKELRDAEAALEGLYVEIEGLQDSAVRADAAAQQRETEGILAVIESETIAAGAKTHVGQEVAAHEEWASAAAWFGREKTRAEKLPEEHQVRPPMPAVQLTVETPEPQNLTGLQKAAIAALALGALAGVLGAFTGVLAGLITMGVAAGVAAILLMLGGRRPQHAVAGAGDGTAAEWAATPPPIASPADESNPFYRWQPSYMVNKYRSGGPSGGERQ